jgi:hypothetical protein
VTWKDAGLRGEAVQTLVFDQGNSSVMYAGTYSGSVFRTANGGADWTALDLGLHGAPVTKLTIDPSGKYLYAATAGGTFEYQRDDSYLKPAVTYVISFLTDSKNFISANDCGDSYVDSNAQSAGPCETFTLYDVNGGALMDGDQVYLQAANGSFVSAESGGSNGCGGCISPVNANRAVAASWETFTIHKTSGPGQIFSGDKISLQSSGGNYLAPEGGGNSRLYANRAVAQTLETFVITMQ